MTVEADLLLAGGRPQRTPWQVAAMGVVAVGAGDELLVHSVTVRLGKISSRFCVAAIAKCRLIVDEERVLLVSVVWGMAIDAADTVLKVSRPAEISVLLAGLMARQTTAADDIRPLTFEDEYLAFIASALDVRLARTMAGLTTVDLCPIDLQRGIPMRIGLKVVDDVLMASFAGVRTYVL